MDDNLPESRGCESSKIFLGPMPVRGFLNAFWPQVSPEGMPASKNAFDKILHEAPEQELRERLVRTAADSSCQ